MNSQKVSFKNPEGHELAARLELPADQKPTACAIFAHCFTCNKNLTAVRNIARALTQDGFAVLRFDFTGLGESEGDFADTDFSSNIEDLIAAATFLEDHYEAPKLLIGHSLGGAAVIFAAAAIPSIQAVATIGAPLLTRSCATPVQERAGRDQSGRKGQGQHCRAGVYHQENSS
jgi:alpha/beta superfamily hydrolase